MGTMVYSLLWVMQDLYHQPYLGRSKHEGQVVAFPASLSKIPDLEKWTKMVYEQPGC